MMAKEPRERRRRAGETLLRDWGIADVALPADLEACFGRDADADLAIANRLGATVDSASAAVLQRLEVGAGREIRKEIKRALYRLQQRGIEVSRPSRQRPVWGVGTAIEGYVSAFDGRGDRLVWLVKPGSGGLLHLFAVVNDPGGLREVAINRLSRKSLREIQNELAAKHDIQFVEVDWRWADFVMHRALGWTRERGETVQGDYTALRAQLTSEPVPVGLEGPVADLSELRDLRDEYLASSGELLLEPELRTWLLAEDLARKALDEIGEIRSSPLVLNQAQQEERFAAIYDRVTREAFTDTDSWSRRLEEMAYYFAKTSRERRAQQAAAASRAVRAAAGVVEVPFCVIYVRRTLSMYLDEDRKRANEEQKSSLIVTPEQARKQRR